VRRQLIHLALVIGLAASPVLAQSLFFPSRNDFETGFSGAGQFSGAGTRVATGDFDGDGNLDAVVTLEVGTTSLSDPNLQEGILVFRGDGRGLFEQKFTLTVPFNAFAGDVVTGHFDSGSDLDFAVAVEDLNGNQIGTDGGILVFSGDGNFGFTQSMALMAGPAEAGLTGLAAAVLNSIDNWDDLVIVNSASSSFTVFLSPAYPPVTVSTNVCNNPVALDLGNMDAQAAPDLALACDPIAGVDQLQTWLNTGAGVFEFVANKQPIPGSGSLNDPRAIVIVDLNNDGIRDLAVANSFLGEDSPGGSITLMRNSGAGDFGTDEFTNSRTPVGDTPRSIDAADIDGDGDQDLLLANWETHDVSVMEQTATLSATPNFSDQPSYTETFFAAGFQVFDAAFGDLNGDNTPDIVATNANEFTGTVSTFLGGGDDLVQRAIRFAAGTGISLPNALAVADFDGDGIDDFAVANAFNDTVAVFRSTAGDAAPTAPFALRATLSFSANDLPFDVLAADLDSDGDQDLLVLLSPNSGNGQVRVFTNNGSGTFAGAGSLAVGQLPWTMVLADFDGINGDDLAVTNLLDHTVSLFSANSASNALFSSQGTFFTTVDGKITQCSTNNVNDPQDIDCLPSGMGAADFDGNGDMDLAVSNFGDIFSGGTVEIFSGNGAFGFTQTTELFSPDPVSPSESVNHETLRVGDVDGVNGDDIVAIGLAPDDFASVFLNDGAGNLTFSDASDSPFLLPAFDVASPEAPRNTILADLNGDDILDLAVCGISSNNVAVMLGRGDGTFSEDDLRAQAFGSAKEPNAIGYGDFDGDGLGDLLAAGARNDDVTFAPSGMPVRADMNASGRVDGFDLALLGRVFGTSKPGPPYEFDLDLNMDGVIDAFDQTVLALAFGRSF